MRDERREHSRISIEGKVSYRGGDGVAAVKIIDLSTGGARLLLSGPEQVGRDVELTLELRGSERPVDALGRVVWARQSDPFVVGIRFLTPPSGL